MYYFNEETIEYFVNRIKEGYDVEDVKEEMINFISVDYEVGYNESVDEAVESLYEQCK